MELFKRPGSDKWQCYVYCWNGTARQRILRSTGIKDDGTAQSRRTAEAVGRDIERTVALGGQAKKRPTKTLAKALDELTAAKELAGRTQHTLDNVLYRGATLCRYFGPDKAMADIDQEQLRNYAIWSRKERGAYTVHRELVILYSAYEVTGIDKPMFPDLGNFRDHKPQRVLELDEQRRLLLVTPQRRRINLLAYLQMGLRLAEPWKITEIDWQDRYALVQGTKRMKDRKGPRRVPIPEELFELMLERRNEWPVFPAWHLNNIKRFLALAGKRAGIDEHLSANDLRGTFATHMARAGVSPLVLAGIMGNSVKMLEAVYVQVNLRGEHLHEAIVRGVQRLTAAKKTNKEETGS